VARGRFASGRADCGGGAGAFGGGAAGGADAGDDAIAGGVCLNGTPRAAQNCSRFARLVETNGSPGGNIEVAMA
jgi:hypothetical protein